MDNALMRPALPASALLLVLAGCGDEALVQATQAPPAPCEQELFRGACVDPAERYEPAQRLDTNNVVELGEPLQILKLPAPPKSGFRIIAPPRTLMPGEEEEY